MTYFALQALVLKSVLYVEMLVNVFVVRSIDCSIAPNCRPRWDYCDSALQDGFYRIYQGTIETELRELGDYPTRISLFGERKFVCSLPFMFPECQLEQRCKPDLDLALPYWFEMWMTRKRPKCPPGLENYVCSNKTTNVLAFDIGGP
jgi:hypothetical protein